MICTSVGNHGIRRAAGGRVGHLHLALVLGLEQIRPGLGRLRLLAGQQLGVEAEAHRAQVDAHRAVLCVLGLLARPGVELRQQGRLVFQREPLLGRLQVRVARAAEPDVGLGVVLLGNELRQRFAGAFHAHVDLGAGGARIDGSHHVAPVGLNRADDVDLPLRRGADGCGQGGRQQNGLFHDVFPM
jgi:hypothetical protein